MTDEEAQLLADTVADLVMKKMAVPPLFVSRALAEGMFPGGQVEYRYPMLPGSPTTNIAFKWRVHDDGGLEMFIVDPSTGQLWQVPLSGVGINR